MLGGHVIRCTDNRAAQGQVETGLQALGQSKVGHERLGVRVEENVGRLQIAVQHAALVRVVDGASDGGEQLRRFVIGDERWGICHPLGQRTAFHQLHGEVMLAVVLPDFVNRDDVRVIKMGGGLRLGLKALPLGFAGKLAGADHLERHDAVKGAVTRAINHAHAAACDEFQQFVISERAALLPGGQARFRASLLFQRGRLQHGFQQTLRTQPQGRRGRQRAFALGAMSGWFHWLAATAAPSETGRHFVTTRFSCHGAGIFHPSFKAASRCRTSSSISSGDATVCAISCLNTLR